MDKDVAGLVERLEAFRPTCNWTLGDQAASTIRALVAENERLQRHVEILQDKVDPDKSCACGYDDPDHVCMVHSPKLREAVEALKQIEWSNDSKWQSDCARAFLATMETPQEDSTSE